MEFNPLPPPFESKGEDSFKPLTPPFEPKSKGVFNPLPLPFESSSKGGFNPLPPPASKSDSKTYTQEEAPFSARHPNLYGAGMAAVETGKELSKISWLKYFYPEEREKFNKIAGDPTSDSWWTPKTKKQAQIRTLLYADLELAALARLGRLTKDAKYAFSAPFKKYFPEAYERAVAFMTKPLGKGVAKVAESEVVAGGATGEQPLTASQRVLNAIKEAKPIRAEQEKMYSLERSKRIMEAERVGSEVGGEKGYYAKLSKMKGELPKAEFESIRGKVGQEDIKELFDQIHNHSGLDGFNKLTAGRGLAKIFGEFGGGVPTHGELKFLNTVFGEEFAQTMLSKRSMFVKMKELGFEVANIPRAIMASFDLSAPLRQGVFLIGRPKQFAPAFRDMFKFFFSEKSYATLMEDIAKRPSFKIMQESGLSLTDLGVDMTAREEVFMSSLAEKIPVIGRGVRMSGRAYTGFLNKLRADVFDDIVKNGAKLGVDDQKFLKSAANFVNTATGRGGLGPLEDSAMVLNATFFSPRLMASRLNLINPAYYATLHPQVRKEALKSLFTFAATASTVGGLAKLGGADVGLDPRSADFMKIKIGNTRFDILGGFQQPIRMASQLISGKVISSTTGKVMTLGEGYKPLSRTDIAMRFLESKFAPVMSFAVGLLRGKTGIGEKFDVPTEVANRFVPMVMQDAYDLYKEEGAVGIPMALPAIFGVGVMSYGGVQSFGLNGKDFPKLNNELTRLKTSMGYPSTMAFGQDLTVKEYKALKEKTGKEVAMALTRFIHNPEYKDMDDRVKVKEIETIVDAVKNNVKENMFPDKMMKSEIVSDLKANSLLTDEEIEKEADKILIDMEVQIKETGETVKLKAPSDKVLSELNDKMSTFNSLKDALK